MRVLFVDHEFHKKTQSSNFFLDLLRQNFERVDVEHVDVEGQSDIQAVAGPRMHDFVVLWQLDFLATAFLAAGYPTVVVPMYDGSANMPFEHWIAMNGASFVCFSRTLHERVTAAGCRSHLVKYFLPPCREALLPKFNNLRGVFWMRRPQDGLTPRYFESLLGSQLRSLHVHNAPDDGIPRSLSDPANQVNAFSVTESRWTNTSNRYLVALKGSNVFFAPRIAEGIGMTMLEAFANGLLVIANDDAVHNEYVANWINGILFDHNTAKAFSLSLEVARDMAYNGWSGAVLGHQEWLDTQGQLMEFMKDVPPAPKMERGADPGFLVALWDAYLLGPGAYRHFLREHVIRLNFEQCNHKIAVPLRGLLEKTPSDVPVLDAEGLYFGTSPKSVAKKFGFDSFDAFSAGLSALSAGFSVKHREFISSDAAALLLISCQVEDELQDDWRVLVHVNQEAKSQMTLPRKPVGFVIKVAVSHNTGEDLAIMLTFLPSRMDIAAIDPPAIRFFGVQWA
jgi:hypothetical protein